MQWTYVKEVPSPYLPIFITANNTRLSMAETCAATIRFVDMSREIIQQLSSGTVHESDMAIKGKYQKSLSILCWHNRCYRICQKSIL